MNPTVQTLIVWILLFYNHFIIASDKIYSKFGKLSSWVVAWNLNKGFLLSTKSETDDSHPPEVKFQYQYF